MTTEYERDLQIWAKGLADRELAYCMANLDLFNDAELDALILEDWRRMRLRKLGAGLAVDSTP